MVSWSIPPVAVALALLASVQTAVCETPEDCDPEGSTRCYWERAVKYGVKVLIPVPGNESEYLKNVCAKEHDLPAKPLCQKFYDGCSVHQKQQFEMQERGYHQLQLAVTDARKCKGVQSLTTCILKDAMENCRVRFSMVPVPLNVAINYEAAINLTRCLNESLQFCTHEKFSNSTEYVQSIASALPLLFWRGEEPMTTPTPTPTSTTTVHPSSTTVTPDPTTHETSKTTDPAQSTTHKPTETTHHSQPTTVEPDTTTNQPSSTEPATTIPTSTTPIPTTPKPSGAVTSVPAVGTLVFISAIWLAQAA